VTNCPVTLVLRTHPRPHTGTNLPSQGVVLVPIAGSSYPLYFDPIAVFSKPVVSFRQIVPNFKMKIILEMYQHRLPLMYESFFFNLYVSLSE